MGKPRNRLMPATQDLVETLTTPFEERRTGDPNNDSIHSQLDQVLASKADTKQSLQKDIGTVSVALGLLRAEYYKLSQRVRTVEHTVEGFKPDHAALSHNLQDLEARAKILDQREVDVEG
ncbi:hypothetical protein NDU88_008346 [Pleurodeles waltl]|uniref:Uncharacterized protein n=1 Tax=Pleurodeles waltl TaxID=8319 RepID=A0AAV7RV27_PLEWA|nr:hypothetical protein NDU88_008346 [Pleurodeles waltl]